MTSTVDTVLLEAKVKEMYTDVAREPHGAFHFERGEALARRVGYDASRLAALPTAAVESFANLCPDKAALFAEAAASTRVPARLAKRNRARG